MWGGGGVGGLLGKFGLRVMRCYTDISPGIPPFIIVWTPQQIENTQPDDIHVRPSQTGATQVLMRGSVLCWCWSFAEIKTNNCNTEPPSNQMHWLGGEKVWNATMGKNQANWSEQDCAAALTMMGVIWNCNCNKADIIWAKVYFQLLKILSPAFVFDVVY